MTCSEFAESLLSVRKLRGQLGVDRSLFSELTLQSTPCHVAYDANEFGQLMYFEVRYVIFHGLQDFRITDSKALRAQRPELLRSIGLSIRIMYFGTFCKHYIFRNTAQLRRRSNVFVAARATQDEIKLSYAADGYIL